MYEVRIGNPLPVEDLRFVFIDANRTCAGTIPKPNGIPPHLNGTHATPKPTPKSKPNGVTPNGPAHTPNRPPPVDASPISTAGKKRKKSLG